VAKPSTGAASARHGDRTNNGGADTLGEAKAAWLYALQGPNRRGRKSVEAWRIRPERHDEFTLAPYMGSAYCHMAFSLL
jgi:hypothetical protein